MNNRPKSLLWVFELGGYPNFTPLFESLGLTVTQVRSARKAMAAMRKSPPHILLAEFNYQSDFRDRTSSLESLLATVQHLGDTKVIVFYEKETQHQLDRLLEQRKVFAALVYPVEETALRAVVERALEA
jgi:DNA-binding NtrC family response regulator